MKRVLFTLLAMFFTAHAYAELVVIGDVDAPNTSSRPQNYDLLENVRNGGTDIAWLTGGSAVNSRYTDLRSRWTNAGAVITDDLTTNVGISLSGRDLVVVSQLYANLSQFDTAAISAIANYLAGGGEVLYIAQVSSSTVHLPSYNTFLSAIGSSMQFLTTGGSSGTEVIDTSTPYGQGVTAFELDGWTAISGGIAVVTLNGEIGVAFGSGGGFAPTAPVPTLSAFALVLTMLLMLLVGGITLVRTKRSHPL
jgi:hypothetical protein